MCDQWVLTSVGFWMLRIRESIPIRHQTTSPELKSCWDSSCDKKHHVWWIFPCLNSWVGALSLRMFPKQVPKNTKVLRSLWFTWRVYVLCHSCHRKNHAKNVASIAKWREQCSWKTWFAVWWVNELIWAQFVSCWSEMAHLPLWLNTCGPVGVEKNRCVGSVFSWCQCQCKSFDLPMKCFETRIRVDSKLPMLEANPIISYTFLKK